MQNQNAIMQGQLASGLSFFAGLWVLSAPFTLGYRDNGTAMANDVLFGLLVTLFAAIRFFGAYGPAPLNWLSWINTAIGVWLIVAPFALGYFLTVPQAMISDVVFGIIIAALSFWSARTTQGHTLHLRR